MFATYDQTTGGAGVLLRGLGAFPAVLPLAVVVLALNASGSASLQISSGCCSGAGDGGGDEEELGELHVCFNGWLEMWFAWS